MTSATHEHTLNVALGEVLGRLRLSWQARSEQTGQVLVEGGRPDILIKEASGWPIAYQTDINGALREHVQRTARST